MKVSLRRHNSHIAIITIDNTTKMNALTRQMMQELGKLWDELEEDDTRCIIITGAGERAFCVGADISGDLSATEDKTIAINHSLLKTDTYSKPIISAINGDCVGGGVELILSADIRCAAKTARFGLPEVKWSIYPFGGATSKLVDQIGHVHAMDLLLTGRLISAEDAQKLNLINVALENDDVMNWALEKAEIIAANSPSAIQAVKTQVTTSISERVKAQEQLEQLLGDHVRSQPDFIEGTKAFIEKRKPVY